MFSKSKFLVLTLCALFATSTFFIEPVEAQKSRSSSSFSSSKSKYGSSSKSSSSTSNKPKYGSSSKPPASKPPASKPPVTNNTVKPKYGSSKPPATNNAVKPKYGASNTPSASKPSENATSQKPAASSSNQSKARDQAYSQRKYVESQKATAPPKPTYTAPNGKTVNVRTSSSTVQNIRTKPSSYYTPTRRVERYDTVIVHHNYGHPYGWYSSQPYYYVGGGYSSSFWWMMSEWSAERRARWLYNNQNNIERDAYERGMKDAAVSAELARLKAENASIDPDYVDPDFVDNPDLMYSQEYVEAAYNPTVEPQPTADPTILLWIFGVIVIGGVIWYVVFKMKITN